MADKVIGMDYRRFDAKRTLWTPYWITSKEVNGADLSDANVGLIFDFTAEKYGSNLIVIEKIMIQVQTVFAGGTPTLDVGAYTLATNAVTTGGNATIVDLDEYIPNADITATSAGQYWAATGDWVTQKALAVVAAPVVITPSDTDVPCVCVLGAADMASGIARVLMQVLEVPAF